MKLPLVTLWHFVLLPIYTNSYYIDQNSSQYCENMGLSQRNDFNPFFQSKDNNNREEWLCLEINLDEENSTFTYQPWGEGNNSVSKMAHAVQGCIDFDACNYSGEANTQLGDGSICSYFDEAVFCD